MAGVLLCVESLYVWYVVHGTRRELERSNGSGGSCVGGIVMMGDGRSDSGSKWWLAV